MSKKNMNIVFVVTLCAILIIFAFVLTGSHQQKDVYIENNNSTIVLSENDRLFVTLPGNLSTGYSWEVVPMEPALLQAVGEPGYTSDSEVIGSTGIFTFKFKAVEKGQMVLKLVYHRPWETVEPLDTFEVTVIVK